MPSNEGVSLEELQLATRNHGMPLEALRYDVTPPGLHYLLVHYDIPDVDTVEWHLSLDGAVAVPRTLDLEELRGLSSRTLTVTLECAGNGRARLDPRPVSQPWLFEAVGNAEWTGVPLHRLLAEAEVASDAVDVVFTGLDRGVEGGVEQTYTRSLPLAAAMAEDVILATGMNGRPLLPQHGFPVRLIVPGWYGMAHVKWLDRITVLTEPYVGYQHDHAYRLRRDEDDPGVPVTRILPRSLMLPPGMPDFMTRSRVVDAGRVTLRGRAWSGFGPIETVEVSVDGGATWHGATLSAPAGAHGWVEWTFVWDAMPGHAVLSSRATDTTGRSQGAEPEWNVGGYEVNAVQRVEVEVVAR